MSKERPIISAIELADKNITEEQTIASEKLITAAKGKNIDELKEAIRAGALIDYKDKEGKNAFTHAYEQGFAEGVEEIIKATSFDVNMKMPNGTPLLIWSIENHNITFALKLINDLRLEVNARDKIGCTALMYASSEGNTALVVELLKHHKIDVNARGGDGTTALMSVSSIGKTEVVVELLKHPDIDVNARDKFSWSALKWAAQPGSYEINYNIVEELIFQGAKFGWVDRTFTFKPTVSLLNKFNQAIMNSDITKLKEIIESKPRIVNAKIKGKESALHYAINHGLKDVAVTLINHGAEVDRRTKNDRDTPLILACAKNQEKVVEAILQRDNNCINEVNRHGKNALDVAGSATISLMLKEKGAKYHSGRKIEASKDKEPKETAVRYAETIAREREGEGVRRRLLGRG